MAFFQAAADFIKNNPKKLTPEAKSNQTKLDLYSLFKLATVGSCAASGKSRPAAFNFVERAKYDAWLAAGEMTQAEARKNYVAIVDSVALSEDWRDEIGFPRGYY